MRGHRGLGPNPTSATNQLCDLGPEGKGTIGKAEGTIGKLTLDLFLLDSNGDGQFRAKAQEPDCLV